VGAKRLTGTRVPDFAEARRQVWAGSQRLLAGGLVTGPEGNVSLRLPGELLAITPTRRPHHALRPEEIVVIDHEAEPVEGDLIPSSETFLHIALYRARADAGAVVHTHSPYASALAVARREIPALLEEQVILLGGPVAVCGYAPAASEELAERAIAGLGNRRAALLAAHGVVTVGEDLEQALFAAELTEKLARIYLLAEAAGGAVLLPADIVAAQVELYEMMRQATLKP
jgi:L-fuculose-phosphate aldolase